MPRTLRNCVLAALVGGGLISVANPAALVGQVYKQIEGIEKKLSDETPDKQWVELLPDQNLNKHWETTGNWKLENGVVSLTPRPGEKGWTRYDAYLWLKDKQYKDFEFQFDYMVQPKGNSGFYFHVGDKKEPVKTGVEVQLYESASKKEGAKLTDHDAGGIIPGVPPTKNVSKPAGEWNTMNVRVKDNKATVTLNGEVVNEVDLTQGRLKDRPKTGHIGFQDHALPLALRNMKIREL